MDPVSDREAETLGPALPEGLRLAAMDYVLNDRVRDGLVWRGRLAATVAGHRADYRVEVVPGPPPQARCDCGRPDLCRHAAAVLLGAGERPEAFIQLDQIDAAASPQALAASLFALAAGTADPLSALRRPRPARPRRPPLGASWQRAQAEGPHAVLEFVRRTVMRPEPLDAAEAALATEAAQRAAQAPARLTAEAGADLLDRVLAGTGWRDLDVALAALLVRGCGRDTLPFLTAAAQAGVWRARADLERRPGDAAMQERLRRGAALLLDLAEREQGAAGVVRAASAHAGLPGVGVRAARALLATGSRDEAARTAEAALLTALPADVPALRAVLEELAHAGADGVYAFLAALWEADPSPQGLDCLLTAGRPEERQAFRRTAAATLRARRRTDLLVTLRLAEGEVRQAAGEALHDGPHAAAPAVCEALAQQLRDEEPLLSVRLLGAAFRRSAEPAARRGLVRRARKIVEDAGIGSWELVRRRHFPERRPSAGGPA
jgi:hypothetical protein